MEQRQPRFDAPIPGMALTHELGARPWQQPAQFTTVDEVTDHYVSRMMNNDEFSEQLVDVMDMGIPLTTIANTIQLAGVMEGKHSIDTGLMVLPVLIETMMLIGDSAGVKYNTGMDENLSKNRPTLSARSVEKLIEQEKEVKEEPDNITVSEDIEDVSETEDKPMEEEPMGLMQRRG
mgnify:FL=1|jgi:hypothetical protein|tara:strand:+ start:1087 stop:1617 length:531 start_codon:yes stop_codon:yes gene_type:complete